MTVPATPAPFVENELELRLHSIRYEARDIVSLEWRSPHHDVLPPFTAGAHIDLRLGDALTRSYSLVNPEHERDRYVIAVKRDPASRGGSRFVHEQLRVGGCCVRQRRATISSFARTRLTASCLPVASVSRRYGR